MLFDCEIRSSIEVEARCAKQSSHQVIGIDMSFQRHIQNTRAIWPIFTRIIAGISAVIPQLNAKP